MAVMQRQPLGATVAARPRRTAGWALVLGAGALLAWQVWAAIEDAAQLQQQREGLAALARAATAQAGAMSAEERQRHAQIESVARTLARPATTLLDTLEAQADSGVVLARLQHDTSTATLELDAWAPNAAARERYLRGLNALPGLRGLSAVDLAEPAAGADRAQRFRVAARWPEAGVP